MSSLFRLKIIIFFISIFISCTTDSQEIQNSDVKHSIGLFGGSYTRASGSEIVINMWKDSLSFDVINYGEHGYGFSSLQGSIQTSVENAEINIDSSIGKNQVPVSVKVSGTSMLPTLQDGQILLLNKTHDIQVGDIVVANSSEYGGIIKRVGDINGDSIYLISDNKNISYEVINGRLYEIKGITTWVDISDINGVIIN